VHGWIDPIDVEGLCIAFGNAKRNVRTHTQPAERKRETNYSLTTIVGTHA
jgi:hypothetical protein